MDVSDIYNFQHLKSSTLGTYRPNALFIRINDFCDLEPEYGDPIPIAIAVHAHEYIHFLHNISTVAGQNYLFINLLFIRYMVSRCNEYGHYIGSDEESDDIVSTLNEMNKVIYNYLGSSAISFGNYNNLSNWSFSYPCNANNEYEDPKTISTVTIMEENIVRVEESIIIGFSFITEGIAYEIEREIRRHNGQAEESLDHETPVYPYLSYKSAIQYWSGRTLDTIELISIGVSCLGSPFPGDILRIICETLRNNADINLNVVLKNVNYQCKGYSAMVIDNLNSQLVDFSKNNTIDIAINEYMKMALSGTELRNQKWLIELEFIEKSTDMQSLYNLIASMVDCNVIQEKIDNTLIINWVGSGKFIQDQKQMSSVAMLQSMLHFSQLHMRTNGVVAKTSELRDEKCPFSGGCQTEIDNKYPENCKRKPWMNYMSAKPNDLVCWYAAGVKALRNPETISN